MIVPVVILAALDKLVAVVAVPVKLPTKLDAVAIPATYKLVAVINPTVVIPEELILVLVRDVELTIPVK